MTERDEELRQALSSITPPPRPEGFFERLQPEIEKELRTPPTITPIKQSRRARFFAPALSAAAVVAVIAIVGSNLGGSGDSNDDLAGPDVTAFAPELASQVAAKASATYASIQGVKGHVNFVQHPYRFAGDEQTNPGSTVDGDFQLRANGDFRFDTQKGDNDWNGPVMSVYSSKTGVFNRCDQEPDGQWGCTSFTGLVATDSAANPQLWDLDLMVSLLRSLAADNTAVLASDVYQGKSVWKISGSLGDKPNGGAEAATMLVDKDTLFPVSVATTRDGKAYTDVNVTNLQVDSSFEDAAFTIIPPADAFVNNPSKGPFVRTTLDAVKNAIGYEPITAASPPQGFSLAEVSSAKTIEESGYGGVGKVNTNDRDVVALTYRSGLQKFTVTTRRANTSTAWIDPLASFGEHTFSTRDVTLDQGLFLGTTVKVLSTDRDVRLWGVGTDYVFTISGDLSEDQLERVAATLQAGAN